MKEKKLTGVCVVLMVTAALVAATSDAIEVKLHDGTVLQAESYKMTGSYVMLTLANGQKVAYAVEDVDVASLKQEEKGSEEAPPAEPVDKEKKGLGSAFGGAVATAEEGDSTFTLTDQDVSHVLPGSLEEEEGGETEGETEEAEEAPSGSVQLSGLQITKVDAAAGTYEIRGAVKNGSNAAVLDVRVTLRYEGKEQELSVTGSLAPGREASFQHRFNSTSKTAPQVGATVRCLKPAPATSPPPDGGEGGGG